MNSTCHSGEVLERRAMVLVQGVQAGVLLESAPGSNRFEYLPEYQQILQTKQRNALHVACCIYDIVDSCR